jgi:hypothetical protein
VNTNGARVQFCGRGLALAALLLAAAACNSSSASPVESNAPAATTSTSVATTTATTATTAVPTPVTTIDGSSLLAQGLASLTAGYHFSSVVTVGGVQTLAADGDRQGDSSRLVLSGDGGDVNYVITPQGSYAQPDGGDWQALDVPPATADPIAALNTPVAVTVVQADGGSVVLRVTVSAASLGVADSGNADVDVTLQNGAITRVGYTAPVDGGTATVTSNISAPTDTTPIVAPI